MKKLILIKLKYLIKEIYVTLSAISFYYVRFSHSLETKKINEKVLNF